MKNQFWLVEGFGKKAMYQAAEMPTLEADHVRIEASYSSINYKDALGFMSKGKIFKKFPMVPGIDVAGKIVESKSKRYSVGKAVLVTGCGLGESYFGGYAKYVDLPEKDLILIPENFSAKDVMALGTAGFTAALAIYRMEALGQSPKKGPILVTGASGGVGSIACLLLAKNGYDVIAQTGKENEHDYLYSLGVKKVVHLNDLDLGTRPLESVKFAGCIDSIGGESLSKIIKHIDLFGNIASIGLASGSEYQASVMPHILRGVSILGISSANCPMDIRKKVWSSLSYWMKKEDFQKLRLEEVVLPEIDKKMPDYFDRKIVGRLLVKNK